MDIRIAVQTALDGEFYGDIEVGPELFVREGESSIQLPDEYITYGITAQDFAQHADNRPLLTGAYVAVYFYSNDLAKKESVVSRIYSAMTAAGFICQLRQRDMPQDGNENAAGYFATVSEFNIIGGL